ncbi:MAG: LPS-assembly protein LptD [Bacteroidales bacterium]|nr:LPS-assembly protein LptD [Bacteroidales bacterium]
MFYKLLKIQIIISILLITYIDGTAQVVVDDSITNNPDSIYIQADSLNNQIDSLVTDTTKAKRPKKASPIEAPVTYNAKDSMDISVKEQKLYLYGEAQVIYQDIELTADYIEFDMAKNVVLATYRKTSDTSTVGKPVFKQDAETFTSDTIQYNFKTKKGIIKHIVTNQGEGFLHANMTKRQADGHIHIRGGKYTTCDAEHPHFYIGLIKAISTDKNIVSGPAYFVMEDIPLPLIIPFGFFPSSKNRSAGILMPTYGESSALGFYLQHGGFYIPINDYVDIAFQGEIYSRGTWGVTARTNYLWKYHFRGGFDFSYRNRTVIDEFPQAKSKDFSIRWNHSQDPKANPTRTFSANVSISNSQYSKYSNYSYNDIVTAGGTQNSSISYSKRFGNLFQLSASTNYNQNNADSTIGMTLPDMSFSLLQSFYPFRSKNMTGKPKWFENIKIDYDAKIRNQIDRVKADKLFDPSTLDLMRNGFSHNIPISLTNFRVLKIINVTPSLSYSGILHLSHIEKRLSEEVHYGTNLRQRVIVDTVRGLTYAHSINPGIGFSVNPKFYGMLQSTRPQSYIQAIRHVLTPSVGFRLAPNMSRLYDRYGKYGDYRNEISYSRSITDQYTDEEYSIFQGYIYDVNISKGNISPISFGLNNNLEMKVLSKKDTTGKPVKVPILNNLNFNASYNPILDSMRWSSIRMNGSTGLFKNKISINFGGSLSPYAVNANGKAYNVSHFEKTGKLLRLENVNLSVGMNFSSASGSKNSTTENEPENTYDYYNETGFYSGYADFNIPWSFSVNYTFDMRKTYIKGEEEVLYTQYLRANGNISLTQKWKIGGNTGYDFNKKEFVTTNISITRDLHCWQMRFSVVPFGTYRNYSFTINAVGSLLRDLKWDKKRNWYDYY